MTIFAAADRLLGEIDINASGERKGDHQRRRHQKVRADRLMHARLEVTIAAEHRDADQIVLGNRLFDHRIERTGVADAGRTAVADVEESEGVERLLQTAALVVIGHHTRARSERCLHVPRNLQTFLDRFLREQSGPNHHRRI